MSDPTRLTLADLAHAYGSGALDPVQASEAYLQAIAEKNPRINAYLAVTDGLARRAAEASALRWRAGAPRGPLDGAPIAIKDNIDLDGVTTTNGCAFGPTATADAEVVRRLKAAGAVILGKLNLHEAALGATTDNPHWGQTHNPHSQGWTPGGSSGGAGAAVAAGLAAAALGTDTMGSVRVPAAYCGVYGIKPTYGLVSTRGVAPLAWTLDHVGPLARTAEDLGLMLQAMAGFDPASPESEPVGLDSTPFPLEGLVVGRVREIEATEMADAVRAAYETFLERLADLGATIVRTDWPGFDASRARRAGLMLSEADAATAMADDLAHRPDRFSPDLRAMLAYGAEAKAPRLVAAQATIREVRRLVRQSLATVDVLVLPTAPMPPFPFSDPAPPAQADFCAPANFAGCPALSLPAGATPDGLPIGMQLMASAGRDFALIGLASDLAAARTAPDSAPV